MVMIRQQQSVVGAAYTARWRRSAGNEIGVRRRVVGAQCWCHRHRGARGAWRPRSSSYFVLLGAIIKTLPKCSPIPRKIKMFEDRRTVTARVIT